ncbi:MAG: hypothetical protein ABI833_07905 [Acidobacteriota bacterium]
MAERPEQIEQHIALTRNELGGHLQELENKVKQAADWRTYYERNPMMLLRLAFGGGVMLASMLGGEREEASLTPRGQRMISAYPEAQKSAVYDAWHDVKAALIGLSSAKLVGMLNQALPGFGEHYHQATRENPRYSSSASAPGPEHEVPVHRM